MALSAQFMSGVGTAMKDLLLANVASAVAGVDINILGADLRPFAFLQGWANDLTAQANTALLDASNAQLAADTANAGLSTVSTGVTANVTGSSSSSDPNAVGPAVQLLNATVQASTNAPRVDIINRPTSWAQPAGGKTLDLMIVAPGGGGAEGAWSPTNGAAGGGGGPGAYSLWTGISFSSLPSTIAADPGLGGAAGVNQMVTWRDDYDRADSLTLGTNYRTDSGSASAQILNQAVECGPVSGGSGENGRWMTIPGIGLLTDTYMVQAQLVAPSVAEATDNYTGIYVAAPSTYGSGTVIIAFVGNLSGGCGLISQTGAPTAPYTASGAGSGQSVLDSKATPFTNTSLIAISRVVDPSTGISTFKGYINGAEICSWTDSSGVVLTGPANRGVGLVCEGNFPVFQHEYHSPAIAWLQARDLGIYAQHGSDGAAASFGTYTANGGKGGKGGGKDAAGNVRPATGSWLNTDPAWTGAQGSGGNQSGITPYGGCGAAGQTGYLPDGQQGGTGLNTAGGAAGTATSLDGQPGTGPTGGQYGPASGGGGGYHAPAGSTGRAGNGAVGGFPGAGGAGGGATLDGQGSNGHGAAGGDGQIVATTHF